MTEVRALLAEGRESLAELSPTPELDARLLLAHVLGRDISFLFMRPEHRPAGEEVGRYRALLQRRRNGRPVAQLVGEREFYGHLFRVSGDTLIPRPETELLVEAVLERLDAQAAVRIADLGTGTGAVAISLALARPRWSLIATEPREALLELPEANRRQLGAENVELLVSDWCAQLPTGLDALVSNPPYVAEGDTHLQRGDVRFEPRRALAAGPDGLAALRVLVHDAPRCLTPGGLLALEHGHDQGEAVRAMMEETGFGVIETLRDLAGHERVTVGRSE